MGLITFNEAAKIVGRSRQTISNWAAKGIFKTRNIAGTNYIDEDTVRAFLDDVNDIEETRIKVERLRESVHSDYEYRHSDMLDDNMRRRYYFVCGSGIRGEFFSIVVKMLMAYGTINEKQGAMLLDFLKGSTLEEVAKKYQCGRENARFTIERAIRKGGDITKIADLCNEVNRLKIDNEALKTKIHILQTMIKTQNENEAKDEDTILCELLSSKLKDYDFSVRTRTAFRAMDLETVGDLCKCGRYDILKVRNCGKKSLAEIEDFLYEKGLDWGMNVDEIYELRANKIL